MEELPASLHMSMIMSSCQCCKYRYICLSTVTRSHSRSEENMRTPHMHLVKCCYVVNIVEIIIPLV